MTEQEKIDIEVKPLDERETKRNARKALFKYRECLLRVNDEYLPKITPSYSLEAAGTSGEYNGSTEKVISHLDKIQEYMDYMQEIAEALNRIDIISRQIVIMQYVMRETMPNTNMRGVLNASETHFYRLKQNALIDFAKSLDVAVYKEE